MQRQGTHSFMRPAARRALKLALKMHSTALSPTMASRSSLIKPTAVHSGPGCMSTKSAPSQLFNKVSVQKLTGCILSEIYGCASKHWKHRVAAIRLLQGQLKLSLLRRDSIADVPPASVMLWHFAQCTS